ncbi:molybdopterin-dependent oxidoreductase [Roseobacter sp. HKCCD9010]|uniref:xanthine dehydrogenase family protein molybdopterin-binding subunit n=1 Tax=unclassified Roseobacter TaxID=196798 RepID=UPI001492FC71|nr:MULTISPECIES: xanthine dehydrogenase family protein molybdopterin-binding subunit [unclassified Roseobacter]MBF9051474.1 molybdopterin-dependent oxidoreductase [Rhodobacterales bacterium HKCCD4356]NNV12998.1 molybdopterin-dependent oxidoreductase [Roseobacter sp. HKCCD7357]NNV17249.1 molybdopterin-dependent oxidoreductase [Roseobacter sp. HKCCD8768]NNV26855.1 molybdopterin-dependent oxidoreductase [Roseobacter sp. HKCCD8192]NNV30975.1 molybdopterin-dependent oxidoreductase [Roseobacter sp. 
MTKFGTSQPVTRLEDTRLLTGHGRYIDDIAPEGALFGYVLRSPVAHGEITELDLDDAREAPGVHLVLSAADLAAAGLANAMKFSTVKNRDGSDGAAPARPILAEGRVRFVGEPVAFVVAESLAKAKDAAEMIGFDFDELEPHMAVQPGGAELHPEAPENLAYDWGLGDEEATEAALAASAHRVRFEIEDNRIIVNSLEPRGCYAELEGDRLHLAVNGQGVWGTKAALAKWFGLDAEDVRVTTPDVGGGFGMKGMDYPEYFLVAHATRALGRPVRWMSERTEAMLSDNAGRDLVCIAELGFDADYRMTAYRMSSLSNMGAYNSQFGQPIQSQLFSRVLTGVYDVQAIYMNNRGIYTNTTQVDAYRGAGRPEAIYTLERAMDYAARELGVDPLELRRRSFIAPEQMPYKTAVGELYDVGAFDQLLTRAEAEGDLAGFAARKAASEGQGKLRGLGVCYYIESILGDPSETAKIELTETGAKVYVGTQSNGQGHETVYAQFVHDQTGLPIADIEVVQGDSDQIANGGGTGGSRSVTTQGTALRATGDALISGLVPFVEGMMEAEDVSFDAEEGVFRAPGSNTVVTLLEAAEAARAEGQAALCVAEETTKLPGRSFPNGCHIAEVEIDRDTGVTEVVRYTVVDDFGNLMNPMLAEGQVHGGVAQGIGQAITEHVVYDDDGQLLTATFMDYGMPRADDMPFVAFHTEPVPSTANALGMKGCGEAGTVGALAAVANGVQDALWPLGIRRVDMPFTPARVWALLQEGEGGIAAE